MIDTIVNVASLSGCTNSRTPECLYDFNERTIKPEAFEEVDITSSSKALVELSFNLCNNNPSGTIVDLFAYLDKANKVLATEAIKIRFKI